MRGFPIEERQHRAADQVRPRAPPAGRQALFSQMNLFICGNLRESAVQVKNDAQARARTERSKVRERPRGQSMRRGARRKSGFRCAPSRLHPGSRILEATNRE